MQPLQFLLPVGYVAFLWWFTTGSIMAIYDRPPWVRHLAFGLGTGVMVVALVCMANVRGLPPYWRVGVSFTCGLLVWGWLVASYYLGYITGPHIAHEVEAATEPEASENSLARRFRLALYASIHHELLALLMAGVVALVAGLSGVRWGLWIYVTLWLMHVSAKLSVFFGVRNFRMEFLPPQFHYLDSLLSKRTTNAFLPVSLILASGVALSLVYRGIIPGTPAADSAGYLMVATMVTLGIIEHWLLILPLPAVLWGWGFRYVEELAVKKSARPKLTAKAPVTETVMKGGL